MTYTGGCHCGAVRYEVEIDMDQATFMECNCSHCHKKGFVLTFVDKDAFTLLTSEDMLMEYHFNKKAIRHLFCRVCGVQSFAEGVEMSKAMINVRCIDDFDLSTVSITKVNGKDF